MTGLLISEFKRLSLRRITRYFPAVLALLMLGGIAIAYFVIDNNDSDVDLVTDIAGGPTAPQMLGPIATLLPVMAFVIGASSIGADIKSGMLEQILTWEPRRLRFLLARLIAGTITVAVIAMALAAFLVALLYGLAVAVGTTDGADAEFWGHVAAAVGRSGIAAACFFTIGLSTTALVNNSLGSIVGFVIYWFVIESFLIGTFLPKVSVYLPVTNADAFGSGKDVERIDGNVFTGDFEIVSSHGYQTAGVILAGWTLVALIAGAVVFERRDIA